MTGSIRSHVLIVLLVATLAISLLPTTPASSQAPPELPEAAEADNSTRQPDGEPAGIAAEEPRVEWAEVLPQQAQQRPERPAVDLTPRSASVVVSTERAPVADMGVWMAGEDGRDVTVEMRSAPAWSALEASFAVGSADGPVEMTFDLERLGVARSADLSARLSLWVCPDPACGEGQRLALDRDLDGGTVSAQFDAADLGDAELVFGAQASSESGSFAATPLSLVDSYQVGLSSGSAETSYDFEIAPSGAGPAPEIGLTYSSTGVDSMAAARNNQPGVAGAGWQLEPGYITRHTSQCGFNFLPDDSGDRCIYTEEYSITLGGTSSRLLPVGDSDAEFRLEEDPQWRVMRRTVADVAADAPDSGGVFWELIQPDGTMYSFGGQAYEGDTNSIFYQWVLGPAADCCRLLPRRRRIGSVPIRMAMAGRPCQ